MYIRLMLPHTYSSHNILKYDILNVLQYFQSTKYIYIYIYTYIHIYIYIYIYIYVIRREEWVLRTGFGVY